MKTGRRKLVAPLRSLMAESKVKQAEQKTAALKSQLTQTVEALARARGTRPVHFNPAPRRKLRGDTLRLIIPDTHGAHADAGAISLLLADAKALKPDEIILLGDHVDCGGFLAQHHTLGYVAETEYSYEDDIAAANAFLNSLQAACPAASIDYLEGNHERRVETWCVTQTLRHGKDSEMLRKALAPEFLLRLAERNIRYHRLSEFHDGLTVPGVIKRGKVFFFHGISTAKHAAAVTQEAVAGNCVFGHTHRHQADVGRRMSAGVIGAWNPGCLCVRQPLWNHGRPTQWTHGYAIQIVARTGTFLHLNIPIIEGRSLLGSLLTRG